MANNNVTQMRDPAHPAGAIVVDDLSATLPRNRGTGSRYFSGNINGEWFVLDAHMNKALKTPFKTEQEAIDKASEKNGQTDKPEIEPTR